MSYVKASIARTHPEVTTAGSGLSVARLIDGVPHADCGNGFFRPCADGPFPPTHFLADGGDAYIEGVRNLGRLDAVIARVKAEGTPCG